MPKTDTQFKKGHKHSKETLLKISNSMKGKNLGNTNGFKKGQKVRLGLSAPWAKNNPQVFKKGQKPHNFGTSKILERNCLQCAVSFLPKNYKNNRKFCSKKCNKEFYKGEKNNMWKGGITPINQKIRTSKEYKDWRIKVFERDNYTCQECNSRGVTLNADHIKPFAYYPELRLVIENGRTLCVPCHKETNTYGSKAKFIILKEQSNG